MNENDREFFEYLNQCVSNEESEEIMRNVKAMSKAAYGLYNENINNGFNEAQSLEITLEYIRAAMNN